MASINGNLPTSLNRSRSAIVFLVAESQIAPGYIAAHPTGDDRFGLTSPPVIGQAGNYADTSEIGPELISVDRVLNYMDYSTFDFEFYSKPNGRAASTEIDLTDATVAYSDGVVTVSTLSVDPSLIVGDTISVVSDGVTTEHKVTSVDTDDNDEFSFPSSTSITSITSASKVGKLTAPEEDIILYRCFGGRKYLSAGQGGYATGADTPTGLSADNATMIQYFLANAINTMTVSSRHFTENSVQMFTATGVLPTSWGVSLSKDGPVTFTSSMQGNRVYYSGTAEITPPLLNTTGETDLTVISPKRNAADTDANAEDIAWLQPAYSPLNVSAVGARFTIVADGTTLKYTDGTTDAIFKVTAISGNAVTVEPLSELAGTNNEKDITGAEKVFLIPYSPTPCVDTTSILEQRSVQAFIADQMDGSTLSNIATTNADLFHEDNEYDVTAVSFDLDRSVTTPGVTEMTGSEYPPASYVINEPVITGSITLLLRPKDFQFMNALREEPRRAIGVRVGTANGRIIEFAAPSVFMDVPTPGDADGATQIEISFTVVRGEVCDDADKFFIRYR